MLYCIVVLPRHKNIQLYILISKCNILNIGRKVPNVFITLTVVFYRLSRPVETWMQ